MALRFGSIQHRPGLLWRLPRPTGSEPWLPLLRAALSHYQVGIASDAPPEAWPADLQAAVRTEPMQPLATIAAAPGLGVKAHDQGHWLLLVAETLTPTSRAAAAQFDQVWHAPAVAAADLIAAGWSAAQLRALPDESAPPDQWQQWLSDTLSPLAATPPARHEVDRLHQARQAAQRAFAEDSYDRMISELRPWLDHPLVDGDLLSLYGTALVFGDAFADAVPVMVRALRLDPGLANAYSLLGVALFALGDLPRARLCFRGALAFQPDHPGAIESLPAIERQLASTDAQAPVAGWEGLDAVLAPFGPASPVRLSVAMIVKDETAWLPRALASVQAIADEVIVVDTGSTDGTPALAASLGAQVHHVAWTDDFAAARNESLAHCTGDWVLVLDADEALTPDGAQALRSVIDRPLRVPVLYQIRIQSRHDAGQATVDWDASRLFPLSLELRYEGRIHEQLPGGLPDGRPLPRVPLPAVTVIHDGHRASVGAAAGKESRDLTLLARSVAEAPSNPFHRFNLGVALRAAGRESDAIEALKCSIDLCRAQLLEPSYVPLAFTHWIAALLAMGDPAGALLIARDAEGLCAQVADYWQAVGQAHYELRHWPQAREAYERCLHVGQAHHQMAVDQSVLTWKPHVGLAEVFRQLGDVTRAEAHFRAALSARPDLWVVRRMLLTSLATHQRLVPASDDLLAVLADADASQRGERLQELGDHLLAMGLGEEALAVLDLAAETASTDARIPALLALARMQRLTGRFAAAEAILVQFPDDPAARDALWHVYLQQGRWADLATSCTSRLQVAPEDHRASAFRGVARLRTGEALAAAADLRAAIAGQPTDADSWNNLGLVAMSQGNGSDAEQAFRQASSLRPQEPTAWLNLARLALHRQAFGEAGEALDRVTAGLPVALQRALHWLNREAVLAVLGGPEQAVYCALITEKLTLEAQLKAGLGMPVPALQALSLAIALAPEHAFLYRLAGGLLHDAGELGLAHRFYAEALRLVADHPATLALYDETAGPAKPPAEPYRFLEVCLPDNPTA